MTTPSRDLLDDYLRSERGADTSEAHRQRLASLVDVPSWQPMLETLDDWQEQMKWLSFAHTWSVRNRHKTRS